MVRGISVFIASVLLSAPAFGKVMPGQSGPAFVLNDINDSTFALSNARTKPLILIFTTKDLGDYSLAWRDSIETRAGDRITVQTILDLGDVSSWKRGLARLKIRLKGSRALLDWDGSVAEPWRGPDRSQVVIMGLTPENRARFRIEGLPTAENVARVIEAITRME